MLRGKDKRLITSLCLTHTECTGCLVCSKYSWRVYACELGSALVSEMRTLVKSLLLLTALVYHGTQGRGKP